MSITGKSRRGGGCPLCGATAQAAFKPFCSQGCRDRDLLNWLVDSYRVPGPPADEFSSDGLDSEG